MSTGVAIIGSGIFAKEQHLPAVLATPSLSLKAVYSRSLKSAATLSENLAQKVDWYSEETEVDGRGIDDLLQNPNIRAVIIVLPIVAQTAYIKKALQANKHVLAEKPLAKDVATAEELLAWYKTSCDSGIIDKRRASLSIAENWRFVESHNYAAAQVAQMGRVLGFRSRFQTMMAAGAKYTETAWRQKPEFQGGYVLDAGIHHMAATRLLLGKDNPIVKASAFTAALQPHLPPVDTVNATLKLRNGASGTFALSMGSTFQGGGFSIACEKGTVTVMNGRVSIRLSNSKDPDEIKPFPEESKEDPPEGKGVKNEVSAWAKGIEEGTFDPRLSPYEALADLKVMEALLTSGQHDGNPIAIAS